MASLELEGTVSGSGLLAKGAGVGFRESLLDRHDTLFNAQPMFGRFSRLTSEQIKAKPRDDVNSVAWLLWPIARCTDVGIRLVSGQKQVLDEGDWMRRMNVPLRIYGTGMGDDEAAQLGERINLDGLKAYFDAVGEKSRKLIETIPDGELDRPVEPGFLRQVLVGEGVIGANADWVIPAYEGHSKGSLLLHLTITHNYAHFGAALGVAGLWGMRSAPDDGKGRAVLGQRISEIPV